MDRLACVNVVGLPLQLLLRTNPAWASLPVAVVEDDRPHALVVSLNALARQAGVRVGQRYATAHAIVRELRAGTVSSLQIADGVRMVCDRLRRFSPHVEPASDTPGVFWLDARGLERLFPSFDRWAVDLRAGLREVGMRATVAVGFSRFGAYALAMSHRGTVVCVDAAEEQTMVQRVPLVRLALDPDARKRLRALGVETVGDFLRLPGDGIRARFGPATDALYQLASGRRWAPLVPVPPEESFERTVDFDHAESSVERLVFVIKRVLDGLVAVMGPQGLAVVEVAMRMKLDDRTTLTERVRPAAPTLDVAQLLAVARLRLDALHLSAGIVSLCVTAARCPATADQRRLFSQQSRRDDDKANQALARLRAECGEQAVVRARICDAHLPSARFAWEPLPHVSTRTTARVVASRPLVRRIFAKPMAMNRDSGPGTRDSKNGDSRKQANPIEPRAPSPESRGPYRVSGAWWGKEVQRDYYFVHAGSGELWWLYYDRRRKRCFLQGQVE